MIDCDLSHDTVMNALIQSSTDQPPTDTLVTCLLITKRNENINSHIKRYSHKKLEKSLQAIYDTSLRRSRDGHLIELPPQTDQIDVSSPPDDQSNCNHESSLTATTSHSKESAITLRNSEESDEELVDLKQNSPLTLFESVIHYMLDNIQLTSSSQYTFGDSTFALCFKYFGQALKDTNLTVLDLEENKISSDLLFDFAKHLKGTQIAALILPIIDYDSGVSKDLASADKSNIDITLVDSSCNEKAQSLEFLPTILKYTQISSLDFGGNPINLKELSSSLIGIRITFLGLRGCQIQNDGLSCLARILKDTQITSIDLSDNRLNCEGLKIFALGLAGSKVTSLNLSHNKIGVEGINFLGNVLKNTQITSIDISSNFVGGESLIVFVNCLVDSKITSLCLNNSDIGVDDLNCLGSVLKNTHITSISINRLSCENLKALSVGLVGSKIESLNLSGSFFIDDDDDDGFCSLCNVLKNTQITAIDLSYTRLYQGRKLEVFAPCLVDTKINCLGLKGNRMGIRELNCLGNVLKNTQVTSIDLSYNFIDDIQKISALCLTDTKITALGLRSNNLGAGTDQLKYLGDCIKDSKITSINLCSNALSGGSIKILAPFLVDSSITSLDLSCNYFDHISIEYLSSVLKNTQITSLKLVQCKLKCNSLRNLVMCLPDTKITSLDLSGNFICCNLFYLAFVLKHTQITSLNISNDLSSQYNPTSFLQMLNENFLDLSYRNLCTFRLRYLGCFLKNMKITSLNLSFNGIACEGLKCLAQVIRHTRISSLNLSGNEIACKGLKYLAKVIRHTRISSLNLSDNKIACEGLKYLAQGIVGSQIAILVLGKNCIEDEGAKYLAECLADTQIIELDLSNNMIGSEVAYELCKSIPQKSVVSFQTDNAGGFSFYPHYLRMSRHPGCFIEINRIVRTKKGHSGSCLINKTYQKSGITKLIFRDNQSVYFEGSFDNINITEIVFPRKGIEKVASILEKSNIVKLKILEDYPLLPDVLNRLNVIALHLEFFHLSQLFRSNLKPVFMYRNIVYLDLSNNRVRNGHFEYIVDVLNGSKIISLDLSNNYLGAESVELLARVLPDTKLTYIDLHGNEIGYQGFKYLSEIVDKTSICWLSLGNNNIEEGFQSKVELSPYIVPRNDTPIEFQIRFLFRELVSLNTATEHFEFIVPLEDSVMTINHYPRLVKHLQDTPIYKMHIYDYFYMQNMRRHDIHVLNRINVFVKEIKQNFISFFESKMMQIAEKFGCECFVSLVEEFDRLNLTDFVEFLLLHRVLYYVDDEQNFLHPFIYKMLHKYQMPLYNDYIEPNKKQQIISYFEEHSDIDGAREIIDLLK